VLKSARWAGQLNPSTCHLLFVAGLRSRPITRQNMSERCIAVNYERAEGILKGY
jgi:hypothetical protein